MAHIEWKENHEVEPEPNPLLEFCKQNEISIKELVDGDHLLIFIDRRALESLHDFLAHDLNREHGGVLVGQPFIDTDTGRTYIVIRSAIPALETEGTPVHLQFTPDAWSTISGIIEEDFRDQFVVGWYHSHPGLGVFMSGTDQATQRAFYHHHWNVAVVADPIARQTGWFIGPECSKANTWQVIPFDADQGKKPMQTEATSKIDDFEREYFERQQGKDWRWLLPFGLITLVVLGLAMWVKKNQMIWGMGKGEQKKQEG
jgi:proteasome lid subunit RPN8/RPN11